MCTRYAAEIEAARSLKTNGKAQPRSLAFDRGGYKQTDG